MESPKRRILFAAHACYLDDANGAAVASRGLMGGLARQGFAVEVLTGNMINLGHEVDLVPWLSERGTDLERRGGDGGVSADAFGVRADVPDHFSMKDDSGVSVAVHHWPTSRPREPGPDECAGFLSLLDVALDRFRPDVLVSYGGTRIARESFQHARSRGIVTVFTLHNFGYTRLDNFEEVDAVLVASEFSAAFHRLAMGLDCTALPNQIDWERVRSEREGPGFVTFVNPTPGKGAYAFARIADELGRQRPDIPMLVVEGRGDERTLAGCGLDLKARGTVHLMEHTPDPRDFWSQTRICLLPSLAWENQPMVAVEAMINGVPVVASDRGGTPETLGRAGVILPLPERVTEATKFLPTAEEVTPWVEAVIRLWDDREWYDEHGRCSLDEARRWSPDVLEPAYARFFQGVGSKPRGVMPIFPNARRKMVVLVPHLNGIDSETERGLIGLERAGVKVVRSSGCSQIDMARNRLLSDALHDGAESILFIDADIGFHHLDALRLLARPDPVVSGIYAKKGRRELASQFLDGLHEVIFGDGGGLYPLKYAATGFLRLRASLLRRMISELKLPLCNTRWSRGEWPFFHPQIIPDPNGHHYLGEDWSFSNRLEQMGVVPLADTSIRLWHYGRYAYGWEDAGSDRPRCRSYKLDL